MIFKKTKKIKIKYINALKIEKNKCACFFWNAYFFMLLSIGLV